MKIAVGLAHCLNDGFLTTYKRVLLISGAVSIVMLIINM
jgi:hypothetical protein